MDTARTFLPWVVNLELTNRCNVECTFCDHRFLKEQMTYGDFPAAYTGKILSDLIGASPDGLLYEVGLVGLGEPLLCKDINSHLIEIAKFAESIQRITINSNMVLMTGDKSDLLLKSVVNAYTYSVNASNEESYRDLMGKDHFKTVVKNLIGFLERKKALGKDVDVGVQVIEYHKNSVDELLLLIPERLHAEANFFVRKLYSKPCVERDEGLEAHAASEKKRYPCWDIYSRVYVDVDGHVYPCTIGNDCYRSGSDLCVGNIADDDIVSCYNNQKMQSAREKQELGGLAFPECRKCNIWSLTPNNFHWISEKKRWGINEKQIRAYGLKE